MKTTTTRSITPEERERLEGFLSPVPPRTPGRLLGLLMGLPVGLTALAFLDSLLPVPHVVNLLLAGAAWAGAAWLFGRWATARHAAAFRPDPEVEDALRKDLAEGRAAVTRYDVEAAVRVAADPGRLVGTTWFLRLADGSVVLLVGPHLAQAEDAGQFPATAFEIAAGEASHFVLSVRRLGERLAPQRSRAPLSDAEWEEVGEDEDEKVPLGWAAILEAADRNPVREGRGSRATEAAGPAAGGATAGARDPGVDPPHAPIRPK